jgi:hypothetical protein
MPVDEFESAVNKRELECLIICQISFSQPSGN